MMQSSKWMILIATMWIQAFTGTNFNFSAYSSSLKMKLGISQVQLNYLATASDLGKAVGWTSGLALMKLPLWAVLFTAATMGLVGYGGQWLVMLDIIDVPYFVVFSLCLLAGSSICWFNTVCFVLCTKNFASYHSRALSLTVSFNGLSAALYNLAANSFNPSSSSQYLLLNALIPLITSIVASIPILRQPDKVESLSSDNTRNDQFMFLMLNLLAVLTGLYLLFLHPSSMFTACLLFTGAIFLLVLPLGFALVDAGDLELHRPLVGQDNTLTHGVSLFGNDDGSTKTISGGTGEEYRYETNMDKDRVMLLGEEHNVQMLISSWDFWLYFLAYLCGGTIGLVYSNNLGQIAQSLGHYSLNSRLITTYSAFSFFGRLLSSAPDLIPPKLCFAKTGWLSVALLLTPAAFLLLAVAGNDAMAVQVGTALIGLSSGFIFSAAVSITSQLFGRNNVGVNHNILITNIPIGSIVYGFLAAIVYDLNGMTTNPELLADPIVCMGRKCYFYTFVFWGCLSIAGLVSSVLLFLRTRPVYLRLERTRQLSALY